MIDSRDMVSTIMASIYAKSNSYHCHELTVQSSIKPVLEPLWGKGRQQEISADVRPGVTNHAANVKHARISSCYKWIIRVIYSDLNMCRILMLTQVTYVK